MGTSIKLNNERFWDASTIMVNAATKITLADNLTALSAPATASITGLVKPDNYSLEVDAEGVLHLKELPVDTELNATSTNMVANSVLTNIFDIILHKLLAPVLYVQGENPTSEVTITNGEITIIKTGSMTEFPIPFFGTWNVSMTSQITDKYGSTSSFTRTKSINIAEIKNYELDLRYPTSLDVIELPNKNIYALGEPIDLDGLVLSLSFLGGSSMTITSGYWSDETVFTGEIIAIYYTHQDELMATTLKFGELQVKEIEVETYPRLNYYAGEEFDSTDLKIRGILTNGDSREVSSDEYIITQIDDTITVAFNELTTSFNIHTYTLQSITVTQMPNQLEYVFDTKFNPEGMIVTAYYDAGFRYDGYEKVYDVDGTREVHSYYYTPSRVLRYSDTTITITYEEVLGAAYTDEVAITVLAKPIQLNIIGSLTKSSYIEGEYFDTDGIELEVVYDDGTIKLTEATYTNPNINQPLMYSNTGTVLFVYEEYTATVSASLAITVAPLYQSITIYQPPKQTSYYLDESLDVSGMIVRLHYTQDGAPKYRNLTSSEYTYTPNELSADMTNIVVMYESDQGVLSASQHIEIKLLESLSIEHYPDKMVYDEGEFFNPSGMVIAAHYSDGSQRERNVYLYEPTSVLSVGDTITITYAEGGITQTVEVDIEVKIAVKLSSITIDNPPATTIYLVNSWFDVAGMVVTAHYSDGSSKVLPDGSATGYGYTYSPNPLVDAEAKQVVVSYEEGDIRVTAVQPVFVYRRDLWQNGTWEEIATLLSQYYDNKVSLDMIKTCFSQSQTRSMWIGSLQAISNISAEVQTGWYAIVQIIAYEHDNLTTPINGHTKAALTLMPTTTLPVGGRIEYSSSSTNNLWSICPRRTWCNNYYFYMLPSELQSLIRNVNKSSNGGVVSDKLFFFSATEIFGTIGSVGKYEEGTQYAYFTMPINRRIYRPDATSLITYYTRSAGKSYSYYWCKAAGSSSDSTGATLTQNSGRTGTTYFVIGFCL